MARVNFRDTYSFDPYGAENAGGLLGMLQAIMRQGEGGPGAGPDPRASGSETPSLFQAADYGPAPTTRITVRPLDPYSAPEETQGSDGDLIGRLLALQAEQGGYQPRPVNGEQSQSAPLDSNFRQLSRMPVEGWQQSASLPIEPSDDQSVQPYLSEGSDTAVQSRMPQNAQTARPDRSLSDRVQAVWDHPHPYGLISMLKTALDGMKIVVQSAHDATSEPSTEEEAFRQNLAREMGPIGAWNAVSSLSMSPGRATRFVMRPFAEAPRIWPQWLPPRAGITAESVNGLSAQTRAPGRLTSSALRLPTELWNPARLSNQITESPNVRAQNAFPSTWNTNEGLSGIYGTTNRPGGQGGILGLPTWPTPMPPIPRPAVPSWLDNTWKIQQLLRDTSFDGSGGGGGATILNQKKLPGRGKKPESTPTDDEDDERSGPEVGSEEWTKQFKAQKAAEARARDLAGRKATATRSYEPGDYCANRYADEMKNCSKRWPDYAELGSLKACEDRAAERLASCSKNGGKPDPNEVKEWGLDHEEIYRNPDK